jgi:hypothetical protein
MIGCLGKNSWEALGDSLSAVDRVESVKGTTGCGNSATNRTNSTEESENDKVLALTRIELCDSEHDDGGCGRRGCQAFPEARRRRGSR